MKYVYKHIYTGEYLRYYKAWGYDVSGIENAQKFEENYKHYIDTSAFYKRICYTQEIRKQKLLKLNQQ